MQLPFSLDTWNQNFKVRVWSPNSPSMKGWRERPWGLERPAPGPGGVLCTRLQNTVHKRFTLCSRIHKKFTQTETLHMQTRVHARDSTAPKLLSLPQKCQRKVKATEKPKKYSEEANCKTTCYQFSVLSTPWSLTSRARLIIWYFKKVNCQTFDCFGSLLTWAKVHAMLGSGLDKPRVVQSNLSIIPPSLVTPAVAPATGAYARTSSFSDQPLDYSS